MLRVTKTEKQVHGDSVAAGEMAEVHQVLMMSDTLPPPNPLLSKK